MATPRLVRSDDLRDTGIRNMTLTVLPHTETAIYRCRLYHLNERVEDVFVEVWDTEQEPYERSGDSLPQGEIVETCSGPSRETVRSQMADLEQARGIFLVGDWESRGSF